MNTITRLIRRLINKFNLDITKYPSTDLRRRNKLLNHFKIDLILDVGANSGQYAQESFNNKFKGKIISFEPLKNVFCALEKKAQNNPRWKAYNFGLGNTNETKTINVSKNTFSSSILKIMPRHVKSAPESITINKQQVKIKRLDDIYSDFINKTDCVLLKIDVQGFEKEVLEGAKNVLEHIKGVQLEMSIEELYMGETLFGEMYDFITKKGFKLHSVENGFYNEKTGKLLQLDGIFFKEE